MSPKTKSRLLFTAKVGVAATLLTWLIRSGALDMSAVKVLFTKPWLLALDLVMFVACTTFGALRWRALLRIAGVGLPVARSLRLHLVGLFFNVVIPGNVGGDVAKALYVARDAAPERRTTILLIVFIERLMGLAGLVTIATIITGLRGPTLWNDPQLRPLAIVVALLGAGVFIGPALLVLIIRRASKQRLEAQTAGTTKLAKLLGQLVAAVTLLSSKPSGLFKALGFSMCLHLCAIGMFTVLTRVIGGFDVGLAEIATVFPLGIITMILPISPAGLGVGHVAFDRLFAAIGLSGGASIFNVYLISQIVPCLLGVFPYLAIKREPAVDLEAPASPPA